MNIPHYGKGKANYYIGYQQDSWKEDKVRKFIVKAIRSTKEEAKKAVKQLTDKARKYKCYQRYSILSAKKYAEHQQSRKKASIEKRKQTIAKKPKEQRKRKFILCPKCRSHTKLLYSEMGGLQTRKCGSCGHTFTYDKWIGDRLLIVAVFGAGPLAAAKFAKQNPVEYK